MGDYTNCIVYELDGGAMELQNVSLAEGVFSQVFLAPAGICAVSASSVMPHGLYESLRNALGTATALTVYVSDKGRYDAFSRTAEPMEGGAQQRDREILDMVSAEWADNPVFSPERIRRMCDALVQADALQRGHYRDTDGALYIRRHDQFVRASDLDPDRQWAITLFGGFLGLHRFAMGKVGSGLLYLCTCGMFLIGWLLDILQLFLGIQKDRYKAVILPPTDRRRSLLRLLPALAAGAVALVIYLQFFTGAADRLTAGTAQSGLAESIANTLLRLFPELAETP